MIYSKGNLCGVRRDGVNLETGVEVKEALGT